MNIDWTDLKKAHDKFVKIIFIHNKFLDLSFPYFMSTHDQEKKNFHILKDFINWMEKHYYLQVRFIQANNKMNKKKILIWIRLKDITFKPSASYTQAQNEAAERSGNVIMKKARAM